VGLHLQARRKRCLCSGPWKRSENGHAPDSAREENPRSGTALAQRVTQDVVDSKAEAPREGIDKTA